MTDHNYYMPTHFRFLSDEQVGQIQYRLHDLDESAALVAAEFEISSATAYRVKNAVPIELLTVDEVGVRRFRKRRKARRRKVS